ncbi:MAG: hypothetical protein IJA78_05575 [Clostridia bacterium]|nr:hypothetical protein [Clostridia bacterium]
MKIRNRALALFLLFALLLPLLAGCASVKRPLAYLKNSIEKTLDHRFGGFFTDLLADALQEGSIALSFGGTDAVNAPLDAFDAKLYFTPNREELFATGSVTLEGTAYDADLWLDEDRAVLSSDALLGSVNFGVEFESLEKDLENSVFRNNSGTAYASPSIDGSTAGAIRDWKSGLFRLLGSAEDCAAEYDYAIETFLKILTEYAPNTRYSENGRYYFSIKVENNHLARALRDTHATLTADRSFCRELRALAQTRDKMQTAKSGVLSTEHTDKVNYWLDGTGEIEALCTGIDNAAPFVLEIGARVRRLNGVLETANLSYKTEGNETFALALDLTDPDAAHGTLLYKGVRYAADYTITTDKWRAFAAEVHFARANADGSGAARWSGRLSVNKRERTFSFASACGDLNRTFTGSYQKKMSSFTLTVDGLIENAVAKRFLLSLTVKAEDRIPELPDYTNLFAANEDRVAAVAPRFTAARDQFCAAWQRAAITKYTPLYFVEDLMGI